jgi:dihydrofolate synthase/folylpolyglutamate synthase
VNVFDTDCAVITSIGLDHMNYLGDTREEIAYEKAGIFRRGRPAVVSDPDMPASMGEHAARIGAQLYLIERDFGYALGEGHWRYWSWRTRRSGLPAPALRGEHQLRNACAALAALDCLHTRVPVDMGAVRRALVELNLPGRFQVLPGRPAVVLDVAHNPQAAQRLSETLARMDPAARTFAVFGMLKDKDVAGVARALAASFDAWHVASVSSERGASAAELAAILRAAGVTAPISLFADPLAAYEAAGRAAQADDRIVVFGSFYTVGDILARLS